MIYYKRSNLFHSYETLLHCCRKVPFIEKTVGRGTFYILLLFVLFYGTKKFNRCAY